MSTIAELTQLPEGVTFQIDDEKFDWNAFSLRDLNHAIERTMIARAIEETGVISRASSLLGYEHHNSLISKLNGPHAQLREALNLSKPRRRHKSLMRKPATDGDWHKGAL